MITTKKHQDDMNVDSDSDVSIVDEGSRRKGKGKNKATDKRKEGKGKNLGKNKSKEGFRLGNARHTLADLVK
jgi:hypothetical protein